MFAVVRFIDDLDKRLHVIHVDEIENFEPEDTSDYDNRSVYNAYWRDPVDDSNSGRYKTQVLMLAESESDARKKMQAKRVVIPKIPIQETSGDDDQDQESQAKRKRAEKKKQKNDRVNAKKNMYDEILKKNLEDAHKKAQSGQRLRTQPRKRRSSPSDSGSSESDGLCSKSELLEMEKKKAVWKTRTKMLAQKELEKDRDTWKLRAEELQQDNTFLKQQVASLQRCLESKIFELAVQQDRPPPYSRGTLPALSVADDTESLFGNPLDMNNTACSERVPSPCLSAAEAKEGTSGQERNNTHLGQNGDFIYMEDGSFHLMKGIVVSGACAKKIFGNKKPTLVVKDTAHAIWGGDVLASRSVTGTIGSKKRALGEEPKQPLTPEKLLVVSETLKQWGQEKQVNTAEAEKNLQRILGEKIQDLLKAKRKQLFDELRSTDK